MPGCVEGCFHSLGVINVSLDLDGYQTGSMDARLC